MLRDFFVEFMTLTSGAVRLRFSLSRTFVANTGPTHPVSRSCELFCNAIVLAVRRQAVQVYQRALGHFEMTSDMK